MASLVENRELIFTANIYKLLSLLYSPPTEETEDILNLLEQNVRGLDPEHIPSVAEMKAMFTQQPFQDLTVDYAKLFVGPFVLLAPPYGSVYLDNQRQVMGDSTIKALEYYRQAGLHLAEEFKQPPDHIVTELEFLYYLLVQHLETGDDQWRKRGEGFLADCLGRWIKDFTHRIQENAGTKFYKNLAGITLEVIQKLTF